MKKRFRVTYNAPVTLSFAIICTLILLLDQLVLNSKLIPALFIVPGNAKAAVSFNWAVPLDYIRLFTHVFGHDGWIHLLNNLAFILLLGPLMEERYGSPMVCLMMAVTAFVTGVINVCFIPSSLMGASGIAFMLILLAAVSTLNKNQIPLSFVFVISVYVAKEILSPSLSNISTIAHIAGGLCGSLFGFLVSPKGKTSANSTKSKSDSSDRTLTVKERLAQIDRENPRYSSGRSSSREDDATVIGTIKL